MNRLANLQRWFQAAITHPAGVENGLRSADASEAIDLSNSSVEAIITRSARLTAIERLSIYHESYTLRLLECLRVDFPAVCYTLGDETFSAFALEYVAAIH